MKRHAPLLPGAALVVASYPAPLRAADGTLPADSWIAAALVLAALILAVPLSLRILRDWQIARVQHAAQDAERLATERALRESQARYREVVESVNEVIFRTDAAGRLTFLNGAWKNISGFPVAESLGQELCAFLHADDVPAAKENLADVAAGRRVSCQCELRLRTRSGEIRWIEATGRAVREGDSGPPGLAGTLDDISARKVAELTLVNINQELEYRVRVRTAELENSNRELEAFSYSVSHDLRAPLRAIDGFARILEEELDDKLEPSSRAHLERIRKATDRMSRLIDDLIDLARLTRQPLTRETVDLSEIAAQIVDELRAEDPGRRVEVQITQRMLVNADRNLMRIVLENLLRNAWKFSARRPVAHIVFRAERDRDRRVFCISDDGAGFDMAFAANLFRPFHRLHTDQEFSGTGIGLATVQRIIARHGGVIWAHSRPGQGAQFYFTLDSPGAAGQ
ncbi:PAS domain S-box protein [Thauera sp. CAU 1555]|uniref:histidine kinase n=1 Tax=Thauera sedimentorum TaxID=2767595 RepID=A0ABR9B8Q8_9RHOO|nr:PAS domain S-box protein [Thauera sedimentorum]MBD8502735.1 PAS domain S-box protein [Thauera sedimentorum]